MTSVVKTQYLLRKFMSSIKIMIANNLSSRDYHEFDYSIKGYLQYIIATSKDFPKD